MKSWLKPIFIFLGLSGLLGLVIMFSGIVTISASSGHWPITSWFLKFSMKRSIKTYSIGIKVPEKMDAWMIQKGAGHYEIGCRQCHGMPDGGNDFLGKQTTPKAPNLTNEISKWTEKELFRIIKHGIKFTSMPAWPDLKRDDEVWAMVAFLRQFPKMSNDEYKKIIFGQKMPTTNLACSNCHGVDGNGRETAAFPKLAGQNYEYLKRSLQNYSDGKRHSGIMETVVAALDEDMIEDFSRFYSRKKRSAIPLKENQSDAIQRGSLIARKGIPKQRVASCVACHGPHQGVVPNLHYPQLAGQFAEYIELQLHLFLKGTRGDSKYSKIMHRALSDMTEEQIKDVALYFESLGRQ